MNARLQRRAEAAPDLGERLARAAEPVLLFATTPRESAERLAARLDGAPIDGILVYDVQDESARARAPRPFPFVPHGDPRAYAIRIARITGRQVVCYKCVGDASEASWRAWLDESGTRGLALLALVGRPSSARSPGALALERAFALAAQHPARFALGGVAIAERHSTARSESLRMLAKSASGCGFFVTQTVYDAPRTLRLLADYARDCERRGVAPRRVVLGFSPCGGARTLEFMKWLGVSFSPGTEAAIVSARDPLGRSIALCRDNLRRIRDAAPASLALGVAVESVSARAAEAQAALELVATLSEELRQRNT